MLDSKACVACVTVLHSKACVACVTFQSLCGLCYIPKSVWLLHFKACVACLTFQSLCGFSFVPKPVPLWVWPLPISVLGIATPSLASSLLDRSWTAAKVRILKRADGFGKAMESWTMDRERFEMFLWPKWVERPPLKLKQEQWVLDLDRTFACLSLSEWGFVVEWDWTLSWCVFHGLMFGPLGLHGLSVWGTSYRATYTMFQACGGYRVLRCRLDFTDGAASTSSFAPGNLLGMLAFLCESSLSRGQHVAAWLQRRVSTSQTSQTNCNDVHNMFTIVVHIYSTSFWGLSHTLSNCNAGKLFGSFWACSHTVVT